MRVTFQFSVDCLRLSFVLSDVTRCTALPPCMRRSSGACVPAACSDHGVLRVRLRGWFILNSRRLYRLQYLYSLECLAAHRHSSQSTTVCVCKQTTRTYLRPPKNTTFVPQVSLVACVGARGSGDGAQGKERGPATRRGRHGSRDSERDHSRPDDRETRVDTCPRVYTPSAPKRNRFTSR